MPIAAFDEGTCYGKGHASPATSREGLIRIEISGLISAEAPEPRPDSPRPREEGQASPFPAGLGSRRSLVGRRAGHLSQSRRA